jgi:hypothetical protein
MDSLLPMTHTKNPAPLPVQVESHRGEQTVFPGPDDELLDGQVMQLIDLKAPSQCCTSRESLVPKCKFHLFHHYATDR